ncbi:pilus assembly protein [Phenylobacterium sp.]|uniref:TadE/TadG family type IV pilus assembly protein n=1 Tax=Phenylobacterium sp. TaxID=1871053 RepID=UPI0028121489|nr:pilus assembly protein [Phenylobacterium sp.]
MGKLRRLLRDDTAATLVESTLVFPLVLVLTFGLLEFGNALWRWNAAEKATAIAARYIATRGPLLTGVPDCFVPTSATAGTSCSEVAGATSWSTSCGAGGGGDCEGDVVAAALARAQAFAPFIEANNFRVDVRGSDLGFVGRGDPVPLITVRLQGLTFDFVVLDALAGVTSMPMPGFDATIVGEDQDEGEGS